MFWYPAKSQGMTFPLSLNPPRNTAVWLVRLYLVVILTWGSRPFRTYNWNVPTIQAQGFIDRGVWTTYYCFNWYDCPNTDLHHFSARFRQAKVVAERCGDTVSFAFLSQPCSGALFRQAGLVLTDSKLLNTISFKYNIFLGGCKKIALCSSTFGELRNILIFQLGWNYHPIWMMSRITCMDPFKMTCGANGVHTLNLPREVTGSGKGGGPQLGDG